VTGSTRTISSGNGAATPERAADLPARSLDQLCDNVLASPGPRARDDIALLLARTTTQTAR
jgi:hypothetical protein